MRLSSLGLKSEFNFRFYAHAQCRAMLKNWQNHKTHDSITSTWLKLDVSKSVKWCRVSCRIRCAFINMPRPLSIWRLEMAIWRDLKDLASTFTDRSLQKFAQMCRTIISTTFSLGLKSESYVRFYVHAQ